MYHFIIYDIYHWLLILYEELSSKLGWAELDWVGLEHCV